MKILLVGVGGALGSVVRYLVGGLVHERFYRKGKPPK